MCYLQGLAKRRFFALLLLLAAGLAGQTRPLTILHTNDLHAHLLPFDDGHGGFAQLAAVIRHEREGCRVCILLNAGDLVQGSPVSTIYRGMPVYEISNLLGIDAATFGNHDFDYGWHRLREFMRKARYPVVSSNVEDQAGHLLAKKPYIVLKVDGLRVAVIGAETETLDTLTTPKERGPWRVAPLLPAVRRYAEEAARNSDIVILLAHISQEEEKAVLRDAPEIPVTITGHVHTGISAAMEQDGRVLVRTKASTEELGRLDLLVDVKTKRVTSWKWRHIPVAAGAVKPAPDVARKVAHWEREVEKTVSARIGESRRDFTKNEVKLLMETAMRERMKADFAFMNQGGVRDLIHRGAVEARTVWNIMPFDNVVVMGRFKGSQLTEAITQGRTVEPDREYTVAVSDFSAANQSAPSQMRTKGLEFPEQGPLLRDLLIDWVKAKKVLE